MYTQTIKRIRFALLAAFIVALSSLITVAHAQEEMVPISHFITPYEDSVVFGLVQVEVFMLDGHGQGVTMGVDNSNWQKMTYVGNGRYTTTWNTNLVADGFHTLTARFSSSSDKIAPPPATVNVYVMQIDPSANHFQGQEETVPVSHFITPYEDSIVSGFVNVEVFMFPSNGEAVEMGVDGSNWQKMTYAGAGRYVTSWNTNVVPVGNHTLTARFSNGVDRTALPQPTVNVVVIHELPPITPEKGS